jgi:hypothetical protein
MANTPSKGSATVGVTEHGNSAELVTVADDGSLLDRRRIDLTEGLPTHPHHHQGSWAVGRYKDSPWARDISLPEAIALVEKVRDAAADGAREQLDALASEVSVTIHCIAIRECPSLPDSIEATIRDNRAQAYADTVMYRQALASAAEARGWAVSWYSRDSVFEDAAANIEGGDIDAAIKAMGKIAGSPWQAKHKQAAAAAIAAQKT